MNARPPTAVFAPLRSVTESIDRHARERPSDVAFRFLGRHAVDRRDLAWSEVRESAVRVADGLAARSLAGRPVAIICPDPRDFVIALCGCFYAGAIAVPVPAVATRRSAERIRSIIATAKPGAVLAPAAVLEQAWIASVLESDGIEGLAVDGVAGAAATDAPRSTDLHAAALMQFTSGSTGAPRGVILSHANVSTNCAAIVEAYGLGPQTRGFSWLPLHHDMGLVGHILTPLWVGCRSTIMDPLLFLQSPLRWLRRVSEERATITSAPNFAYELCVKEAETSDLAGVDLSSLTTAVCGGEPVWPETMERFCRTFAPFGFDRAAFAPSYGLAEATLLVSSGKRSGGPRVFSGSVRDAEAPGDHAVEIRTVSLGKPVRGIRLRILDADGKECPDGVVGEIEIAGESVGRLVGEGPNVDAPASVATGDLGFVLGGEVHVSGRRKELIILRGQNVYPADIENAAVRADPAVKPGAVAAVAVRDKGTEAMFVVFEADRAVGSKAEFSAICRRLNEAVGRATGHIPSGAIAVPFGALPRTTSGKIRRNAVAELYVGGCLPILATSTGTGMDAATEPGTS